MYWRRAVQVGVGDGGGDVLVMYVCVCGVVGR